MGQGTIVVTTKNFDAEVVQSAVPVVIDLWRPGCPPCVAMAPVLEELATKFDGQVKVVKVNVWDDPEIARAFEVNSVPTLAVVYKGTLVGKEVGFGGKPWLEELFTAVLDVPKRYEEHLAEQGQAAPEA
jgi:thioredoxin 1